ncbi:hypothetical protein BaRGS_00013646 [Batillaria attramentaria]|uniref:SMP-30/Gluconolactonase/LRE-like region domain-containing protein n=1 Tax=Batillaria attramentaria TaxID=370345 RepID=A0ABD0L6W8_9CAEN
MAEFVADDVELKFTKVLEGAAGSEGPVFDRNGNFFMVAPEVMKDGKFAGQILRVDLQSGQSTVLCEPNVNGYGGIPAGCQCDKEGIIYVADMRLGILKVSQSGEFTQVAKVDSEGQTMQACNDCIFDYHGNLWVTAPAGDIAPAEFRRSDKEPFGSVYCLTKTGKVVRVDTGMLFPNGIAVQHDASGEPRKLIVAETFTKTLWGYDIKGPGEVTGKAVWGMLPGDLRGGPDGLDFDDQGYLLAAHHGSGRIEVFPPEGGNPVKRIVCPFQQPSNLHFKPKSNTVYVTEHDYHGLWYFEWNTCGMPQFCEK